MSQADAEASDEPTTGLFHKSVVVVSGVEQVGGFKKDFPRWLLPRQAGVEQAIGAVVLYGTVEVGVGADTILPSSVQVKGESLCQWETQVGYKFVAQIL